MILLTADGRAVGGTPLEMVRALMRSGLTPQGVTLAEYVQQVTDRACWAGCRYLAVKGKTEEELAASFIKAAVKAGLLTKLPEA